MYNPPFNVVGGMAYGAYPSPDVVAGLVDLVGGIPTMPLLRQLAAPMAAPALADRAALIQHMQQAQAADAQNQANAAAALAAFRAPGSGPIAVADKDYTTGGQIPAGFESEETDPGDLATVLIAPQVPFCPKRLLVARSSADSFTLESFVIGQQSQLIGTGPVPCESFSAESINQGWNLPTLQIGQQMQMKFRNVSGAPAKLRGAWLGIYAS